MRWPVDERALRVIMRETVRRNRVTDGLVYVQITRGVAPRDHGFPAARYEADADRHRAHASRSRNTRTGPRRASPSSRCRNRAGRVATSSRRACSPTCSPSSTRASTARSKPGSSIADGFVTEGASTNAWIVDSEGRPCAPATLGIKSCRASPAASCCRSAANSASSSTKSRSPSKRPKTAREAFLTAASIGVMPVVSVDERKIGTGTPGPVAAALAQGLLVQPVAIVNFVSELYRTVITCSKRRAPPCFPYCGCTERFESRLRTSQTSQFPLIRATAYTR